MIIYPAIDLIEGQCVRLTQGLYDSKKVYSSDPVTMAKEFENGGFTHLHMVDLDGAKQGKIVNQKVLESVVSATNLKVDFGGGIRSEEDVKKVLDSGASKINLGSIAVKHPKLVYNWIEKYGADKIILSADIKGDYIAVHGWQESSEIRLADFISDYLAAGINTVTCTDIAKDGKLNGASVKLYERLVTKFPVLNIISSGGVDSIDNLLELEKVGCSGAIVGKAIYEKKITVEALVKLNRYAS